MNPMNGADVEQADDQILTHEISDDALEAMANASPGAASASCYSCRFGEPTCLAGNFGF